MPRAQWNSFESTRRPDRFICVTLLAILFGAGVAGAQDPGQQMPSGGSSIPGRGLMLGIDGRVVSGAGGANVAGARVILTDNRGSIHVTYTRDGGSFQFRNLVAGRYTLTVSHQEYGEYTETIELVSHSVTGLLVSLSKRPTPPEALQPNVPAWALNVPEKAQQEFNKGLEALERGDARGTIRYMQKALAIYPKFAAAYAALGNAHQNLRESEAAVQAFKKALEVDDTLYVAWLGLGTLYAAEGRHQESESHLLHARSLRPDDWQPSYQLAELYWGMKDAARTEEHVRRALELQKSMPRIHVLLINALVSQEKYPAALTAMEAFLAGFPKDPIAAEVARKRDLLRSELARTIP